MLRGLLLFAFLAPSALLAETYKLDGSHTTFGFSIKHLNVIPVPGRFKKFNGTGSYDPKTKKISDINLSIDPSSIDTDEPDRDNDLRSPNFFDVAKFKDMTFKSSAIQYEKKSPSKITGMLTMHGVSKEVTLDVEWGGIIADPWGTEKLLFQASGKIDRTDWGLNWNKALSKAAGVFVSNDVKLIISIVAVKDEDKAPSKATPKKSKK